MSGLKEMIAAGDVVIIPTDQTEKPYHNENFIGLQDAEYYYLFPTKTYSVANKYYQYHGKTIGIGAAALWKQLHQAGIIVCNQQRERVTVAKKFAYNGKKIPVEVLQFSEKFLS